MLLAAVMFLGIVSFGASRAYADPAATENWPSFRGNANNMAISDAELPTTAVQAELKWAKSFGSDWMNAPSSPIIANGCLFAMSNKTLYKISLETGETLATAEMAETTDWINMNPTYADGKIFCPLTNGTVQAFDAETLKSLWVYKDTLKGQASCPITVSDGMLYTGFWNGNGEANYVALTTSDDDTTKTDEEKSSEWVRAQNGGYYWAGAVVVGNAVIFGSDGSADTSSSGHVLSLNKTTGEQITDLEVSGPVHSSIAYDNGKIYFTTTDGCLCSASVDVSTGTLSELVRVQYEGVSSTCTPVVYKGRVYFGAGGWGSDRSTTGKLYVADASTLKEVYSKEMKGYPQCSVLLSTAYEKETGYIYIYSTYNNYPGGISVLKTKADAASGDEAELTELFDAKGYEQYCTASPICDDNGTIYYKNDSANIFALSFKNIYVKYDGNGSTSGTAPAGVEKLRVGDKVTVSDNTGTLAKKGYKFAGWNTQADGKGKAYKSGDEITLEDNVTLYADWVKEVIDEPNKPADPNKPENPGKADTPATGDDANFAAYALLLILAGGAAASIAARRHRA